MAQATTFMEIPDLFGREQVEDSIVAYESPEIVLFEDGEQDQIVWYVVGIWVLMAMGLTIFAAISLYCIYKGGSLVTYFRLNPFQYKIGCTR